MGPLTWMLGSRKLTEDERRLVLRSMTVIAIPLALITTLALTVGFLFFEGKLNGQIHQNREAILRADEAIAAHKKLTAQLNNQARLFDRKIAQAVFDECVQNEAQDNVLVNQVLRPTIQGLRQADAQNPSPDLERYIQTLTQAILAREPPDEKDCQLPGRNR
jgi:hypothetical protein